MMIEICVLDCPFKLNLISTDSVSMVSAFLGALCMVLSNVEFTSAFRRIRYRKCEFILCFIKMVKRNENLECNTFFFSKRNQ